MFIRVRAAALRSAVALCATALLLALPGCREGGRAAGNDAAGAVFAAGAKRATDLHLAYSHDITIGLLARQIEPHFIAARDPSCILLPRAAVQ